MITELYCKRCQEPDTFNVLCDTCEAVVYGRTDRLIARSKQAKDEAETICKKIGQETLQVLCKLDEIVTDQELVDAFNRHAFRHENPAEKYSLCLRLLKLEDEREGYAELAELSCRIPYDDKYLEDKIIDAVPGCKFSQDWKNQ